MNADDWLAWLAFAVGIVWRVELLIERRLTRALKEKIRLIEKKEE